MEAHLQKGCKASCTQHQRSQALQQYNSMQIKRFCWHCTVVQAWVSHRCAWRAKQREKQTWLTAHHNPRSQRAVDSLQVVHNKPADQGLI